MSIFKDYLLCLNIISYSTLFVHSSFQISAPPDTETKEHVKNQKIDNDKIWKKIQSILVINHPVYMNFMDWSA